MLCLVCSVELSLGEDKKIVTCRNCQITYHRSTVLEADPEAWEHVRTHRLFSLSYRKDVGRQILFLESPLSTLKGFGKEAL